MEIKTTLQKELYRYTLICVDSCDKFDIQGRFFHPYLEEGESFRGLTEFLLKMEWIMDEIDFPQASVEMRKYTDIKVDSSRAVLDEEEPTFPENWRDKGKKGTFYLRILYRQNASWQGTVTWAETGEKISFRSVLELIHLMNSGLHAPQN